MTLQLLTKYLTPLQVYRKRYGHRSDCNDPERTERWIAEATYGDPIQQQVEDRTPLAEGFEIRYT